MKPKMKVSLAAISAILTFTVSAGALPNTQAAPLDSLASGTGTSENFVEASFDAESAVDQPSIVEEPENVEFLPSEDEDLEDLGDVVNYLNRRSDLGHDRPAVHSVLDHSEGHAYPDGIRGDQRIDKSQSRPSEMSGSDWNSQFRGSGGPSPDKSFGEFHQPVHKRGADSQPRPGVYQGGPPWATKGRAGFSSYGDRGGPSAQDMNDNYYDYHEVYHDDDSNWMSQHLSRREEPFKFGATNDDPVPTNKLGNKLISKPPAEPKDSKPVLGFDDGDRPWGTFEDQGSGITIGNENIRPMIYKWDMNRNRPFKRGMERAGQGGQGGPREPMPSRAGQRPGGHREAQQHGQQRAGPSADEFWY